MKDKEEEEHSYVKCFFDVKGFFTNKFTHFDQNLVSRLCNVLVTALIDRVILLKWVIIVMDDDLIKYTQFDDDFGVADSFSRLIDNVMKEHLKSLAIHKEYLPQKAKCKGIPQILWIEAPLHDAFNNNSSRSKFNTCLNEVVKFHADMHVLSLKKVWDPVNLNLFDKFSRCFTREGLHTYRNAVDRTFKFADTLLLKKLAKQLDLPKTLSLSFASKNAETNNFHRSDRFHWNRTYCTSTDRKPLLAPPAHR